MYLKKAPIALERMSIIEGASVPIVRYTKHCDDGSSVHRYFDPLEFLAELSAQAPDVWEQTVRYFGIYSARTRGAQRLNKSNNSDDPIRCDEEEQEPIAKVPSVWEMLIKLIYEVDPLICPKCNGDMKIIAFVQNPKEINKLCNNLGIASSRDPPPFENNLGVHLVPDLEQTLY